jgi:hypothetical protein
LATNKKGEQAMSNQHDNEPESPLEGISRRSFLGAGSAALATVAAAGLAAQGQTRENTAKAESDHSSSDPGPENRVLLDENPDTNTPPPTDHGDIGPVWYFIRPGTQARGRRRLVDSNSGRRWRSVTSFELIVIVATRVPTGSDA